MQTRSKGANITLNPGLDRDLNETEKYLSIKGPVNIVGILE